MSKNQKSLIPMPKGSKVKKFLQKEINLAKTNNLRKIT